MAPRLRIFRALTVCAMLAGAGPLRAETDAAASGLAIARAAEAADTGFGAYTARGEMVLYDTAQRSARRGFDVSVLEGSDTGDRSLMVFSWPPDIAGTGLLTHAQRVGSDDQWLYLPALKRVKRIASRTKAGAFVGSEFAYEDLVPVEVEQYTYQDQGEVACPGQLTVRCHQNQRVARAPGSSYSRQVVWLDTQHYRLWQVDYYDRAGALRKRLTAEDYALYRDRYWRPALLRMQNLVSGKRTEMRWTGYDFTARLGPDDFTTRALERTR